MTPRARTLAVLWALVLGAFVLRAWHPERLGIDHFDEGVYAFSASAVAAPGEWPGWYPSQERFAPPVYFGAAGWLARAGGLDADQALIWLNIVLGTATVGLLGWVGWRWFGPLAGVSAAALLACSEAHVALSRAALTDVTFGFLHLLAVLALVEALRRERWLFAALAGLAVGAAWNTKYHGWLALVCVGLALAPVLVVRLRRRGAALRPLGLWALAAAVAAGAYAPWAWFVQAQPGGYAGLAAYQRTMLRDGWLGNLARHAEHQIFLEGAVSRASLVVALACALWIAGRVPRAKSVGSSAALLGIAGLLMGGALGSALLALVALRPLWRHARELDLTALTLLAWLGLWTALTPLYQPYARLLLPLSMAWMLAAGLALQRIVQRMPARSVAAGRTGASVAWVAAAVTLGCALGLLRDASNPWRTSRGAQVAVDAALEHIPPGARVFVPGAPEIAWYLQRAGREAFEQVPGAGLLARLEQERGPAWVVCGIYPARTGAEERLVAAAGARLELLARLPLEVKDLRLLDDFRPAQARAFRASPGADYALRVYRFSQPEAER